MPDTRLSLVVRVPEGQSPILVEERIPIPSPGSGQVLVRISHAAQNPTDVKSFDTKLFADGTVIGCDFAGEVIQLGPGVTRLSEGDAVAGFIWGGETKDLGAYSEYTLVDEKICFKIPKNTSREQASTIPLAAATAWLALYSKNCLGLDRANAEGTSVLIWGGSSSVGLYAIQLASRYGFTVITTCSPRNTDLVLSNGAKYAFDYNDENVVDQIQQVAPDIKYAFNSIGSLISSTTASQITQGGHLCTVQPNRNGTENVVPGTRVTGVLVWKAFLKDHLFKGVEWPVSKHDHELAAELFQKLPAWLEEGKVKSNKPKVYNGLSSVPQGFQEHRDGGISGYKIVYKI